MNIPVDADIANRLYAGILFDTGEFSHSNTSSQTLRVGADLIDCGADRILYLYRFSEQGL
jgi:phosphoesterase RecJ-like protein